MLEFFRQLFDTDFMPHVICLRTPGLIWLHAVSDGLIALAYFLIPFGLIRLVRKRRDLAFHSLFLLFAMFILSCGATHVMEIITLWTPVYRLSGIIKVITAAVSLCTAVLLIRLIPKISLIPSPEQWRAANAELKLEIKQREAAEIKLLALNANLERRVDERTKEYEEQNLKLQELKTAWDLAHGFIRKPKGQIDFWCEGSEHLYGFKKEEAVGRLSHELLATAFPKPLNEIESDLETQGSWSGELIHTAKSGVKLHVASHWILQRKPDGSPVSVIEVNNDMTDRLRADEALQRLADLVESSEDAIIGNKLDGSIVSWNSSAETLLEYSAAEIFGQSVDCLIPIEDRASERVLIAQAGKGSGAHRYEGVRVAKSGRKIPVHLTVSPIRNSCGQVIGTSQIVRDISEEKEREAAFRLSEERQRLAVEAGQIGLWYLDLEEDRCIWSARCKELHGLGPDQEPPYGDALTMVHADDRQYVLSEVSRCLHEATDLYLEYRTKGLDLRVKWIQSRGRPQLSADGRVIGIHGTVMDLTARRQMEEKLRRVNRELEQFAYAAAHDLQEPLRNVALAADLLKIEFKNGQNGGAHSGEDNEARRLVSVLYDNARRMEGMVKDLLAYTRSVENTSEEAPWSDANAILQKALANLSLAIRDKEAKIKYERLPSVPMHETHLLQIFQNLIQNAMKYSGDKSPEIYIGARTREEDNVLYVQDNGIGIPLELHERAFRMFKRLHSGATQGNGIGLAVCKRIVEHYGGRIWIESAVGVGTTLHFTIPNALHN